jgi:hypothetical protein
LHVTGPSEQTTERIYPWGMHENPLQKIENKEKLRCVESILMSFEKASDFMKMLRKLTTDPVNDVLFFTYGDRNANI